MLFGLDTFCLPVCDGCHNVMVTVRIITVCVLLQYYSMSVLCITYQFKNNNYQQHRRYNMCDLFHSVVFINYYTTRTILKNQELRQEPRTKNQIQYNKTTYIVIYLYIYIYIYIYDEDKEVKSTRVGKMWGGMEN